MRHFVRFVAICLLAVPAFGATVTDIVRQYQDLRLGQARTVTNYTVQVGHSTFSLSAGTATPVLAGEQPVGVFLSGPGRFTYESVTRDEFTAVQYNAKHGDVKLTATDGKLAVNDSFLTVLLLGNGLPELTGPAAAAPTAELASHRAVFERNYFHTPAGHLFAYQALDAPRARVVHAEVAGGKHPFRYTFDDAYSHDETLMFLRTGTWRVGKWRNALWSSLLSTQPIGRGSRDVVPARVKLTDVDVNLTGHMNEEGTLTVIETIVPQQRPASVLRFDLTNEQFFDSELPPRKLNLRSVTDEQGTKLPFVYDAGDLLVSLAKPAAAGTPIKLRFEIDGNFLYRPDKSNYWELGISPWFPWVRMHEQSYTFHSVVKVEKPFVVFASGKTIRRAEEGNFNVVETKLDKPVGWVAILAGKYNYDEETRNGVTVRVASFLSKNTQAFKTLRGLAFSAIEEYPRFLGPFPFEEITVIEKNEFGYGQAPAGIVFITKEAFTPKLGEANDYVEGVNMRFVHELAHQYWGSTVRMPSLEEQWIDEAFAEYSAALFLRGTNLDKHYQRAFLTWKADAKTVAHLATIPMANRLSNPGDPLARYHLRNGLIYAKGALLLAALHRELGEQTFLTFMKSYQKSFRSKGFATTRDAIDLLQFLTKKDYGPWFEQNFYGTDVPDVKLK